MGKPKPLPAVAEVPPEALAEERRRLLPEFAGLAQPELRRLRQQRTAIAGPVRVHCSGTPCNGRVNLPVSKSVTDARTWEPQTLLIHGPNPPNSSGGSGYSCLSAIPSRPQEMGLLFERDGPECW